MSYKQEIKDYKAKAKEVFQQHLTELEDNVVNFCISEDNSDPASKIYLDYQASTLKLIESKIKIDNEFLKQINITSLERYKDLEPAQFQQIQEKIVSNHKQIIEELKTTYEQFATESREQLKLRLVEQAKDNDLDVSSSNSEDFFPDKMGVLTVNFVIILVLLVVIIGLVYYYTLM